MLAVWQHLSSYHEALISFIGAIAASLLTIWMRPRVKLIYGRANNSLNVISVPKEPSDPTESDIVAPVTQTEIYVEKFYLQNIGKGVATQVEFVLSAFPADIRVWQPRVAEYRNVEKGNCLISIPRIAPSELVVIDCVYLNQRAAFVASVKCAECLGQEVQFSVQRSWPTWFERFAQFLVLCGIAYVLQIVWALLVAGATP